MIWKLKQVIMIWKLKELALEARMALALRLIGSRPVLANVRVGGPEGYGVVVKGKLWHRGLQWKVTPALKACVVVFPEGG